MQQLQEIIELIDASIKVDANNLITGGGIIEDGYNSEVDDLRKFIEHANEWLNEYTEKLIESTSINTLKIKYTSASGYFIEVPLSQKAKIPENFIHKTTLVNAMRFTTTELQEFDNKISNGEVMLYQKEYELFKEVSGKILNQFSEIKKTSAHIAELDFYATMAHVAYEYDYVKPEIHTGYALDIVAGRHPVVEQIEKNFISNELFLDNKKFVSIITGPNMG